MQDCKAVYDSVANVGAENVTFSSVIQPLLNVDTDSSHRGVALQLPGSRKRVLFSLPSSELVFGYN